MSVYSEKRSPARLFLRRLSLLALLILVIAGVSSVWSAYQKERESAGLRAQAEREHADLASREEQLSGDLSKLNTDRGKEEALRTQYAMAHEGEKLIVIIDPSSTTPIQATSTPFDVIKKIFWPW